jgi:hypothetical protein
MQDKFGPIRRLNSLICEPFSEPTNRNHTIHTYKLVHLYELQDGSRFLRLQNNAIVCSLWKLKHPVYTYGNFISLEFNYK